MENSRIKVLFIEDDEDDYILVRSMLSQVVSTKYDIHWVDAYDEALEASCTNEYDVYLLDYYLGEHYGLDLFREIIARGSDVPVIFLTGRADYDVDVEVMRAGASDYLEKGQISSPLLERSIRYAIERRLTAEALRKSEEELRQSQKMEAIGTLAGGIAHDFNNILAAIIGFSEMALDEMSDNDSSRHSIERVLRAGIRGRDLVKQILMFSRKAKQEKVPLVLSSVAGETLTLLRASIPATIDIRLKILSESGLILADAAQIQQVIMNLCTNAAHAMRKKGGAIDITICDRHLMSEDAVCRNRIAPGAYLELSVKDTGEGMSKEILNRIFDPFFTTKKPGEATGLGLSVSLGLVTSHGGAIHVESEARKGSVFHVYLPQYIEEYMTEVKTARVEARGTERILFVDDEESLAEMGRTILNRLGYHVVSKTDSREALTLFRRDPFGFDLIVTDHTMPRMTGVQFAKRVLEVRKDIPLILCTGYSREVDEDMARRAGIKAFVMKPLTGKELGGVVRNVLDEKET